MRSHEFACRVQGVCVMRIAEHLKESNEAIDGWNQVVSEYQARCDDVCPRSADMKISSYERPSRGAVTTDEQRSTPQKLDTKVDDSMW